MNVNKVIKLWNQDKRACLKAVQYALEFELRHKQTTLNEVM